MWPSFDGWCVSCGVDPLELPSDRWLNLIYYFATRNLDKKGRDEFNGHLEKAKGEWIRRRTQRQLNQATSDDSSGSNIERVDSTGSDNQAAQRGRRLPPRPSWYGSRDGATMSTLAAGKTLTSRGGGKRR